MARRIEKALLPNDLESVLKESDFSTVFKILEEKFHVAIGWRADFFAQLDKLPPERSPKNFLVSYLKKHLEPSLRIITRRNDEIVLNVIRYIVNERIKGTMKISHRRDLF